jgi:lambda family phage portal protein
MNVLDKIIGWFNPKAGLQRTRARAAETVLLSYEGVRSARRMGEWRPTGTSGNAEMGPAIGKLRDNAEDLVRNNAFAAKAVRRWCRRVIGYGITPQADTGDLSVNERIDALWKSWSNECCSDTRMNIYSAQRMITRTAFTRGECLIRLWDRLSTDGLQVPFQIQVLEPDNLDTYKTEALSGGGYVLHGVQFDGVGRIKGYWLFGQHPGEIVQMSQRGMVSKFVPAEYVIHHVPLERPGDVRGVSRFAPVINKLRDLDEYSDAEIMRKKIEACLAMFVGQDEGPDGPTMGGVITDADGKKIESFQPGMIAYGNAGQKPEFFAPTSGGDYAAHKTIELREIAAGLDQPYIILGEDWNVSYSNFRGGAVDERDSIDEYRWLWFIPQVMDRIWQRFIQKLFAMGKIPEVNYGVKWNPPPFDLLDRKNEAEADELELRIGKKTWAQLVGDQGIDPVKQLEDIKRWKSLLEEAGVSFNPKVAANPNNTGGTDDGGTNQTANPKA